MLDHGQFPVPAVLVSGTVLDGLDVKHLVLGLDISSLLENIAFTYGSISPSIVIARYVAERELLVYMSLTPVIIFLCLANVTLVEARRIAQKVSERVGLFRFYVRSWQVRI